MLNDNRPQFALGNDGKMQIIMTIPGWGSLDAFARLDALSRQNYEAVKRIVKEETDKNA